MEAAFHNQTEQSATREVAETLARYRDLFVNRADTYARQRERSRQYYRVRQPLADQTLMQHLRGEITVGLYSIDEHGQTKWSAIDSDRGIEPLLSAQAQLQRRGVSSYLELSRQGGHLWIFWAYPISSCIAKKIVSPYTADLEVFPAGDIPDHELGLCIRAPLGVHRVTGRRYPFVDRDVRSVSEGMVRGQMMWLHHHVQRADPTSLMAALPAERPATRAAFMSPLAAGAERPIRAWLEANDIREVVGRYVKLSRSGIGRCPWGHRHKHGDCHPSFQVFDTSQRFWCYSERVGGDAFTFLCLYHHLDAATMLRRLRHGQS